MQCPLLQVIVAERAKRGERESGMFVVLQQRREAGAFRRVGGILMLALGGVREKRAV
jgi:hypothetical protein